MVHFFDLGGQSRPVLFGFAALYQYEQRTGRNALADFAEMQSGKASVTMMVDLLYSGLCAGARHEQTPITFNPEDVSEWIGSDMGIFERIAEAFAASFSPPDGEKKKKPLKAAEA